MDKYYVIDMHGYAFTVVEGEEVAKAMATEIGGDYIAVEECF